MTNAEYVEWRAFATYENAMVAFEAEKARARRTR